MRLDIRPACLAGTLRRRGIAVQAVEPLEQLRAVGDALGSSRLDQVAGFPKLPVMRPERQRQAEYGRLQRVVYSRAETAADIAPAAVPV